MGVDPLVARSVLERYLILSEASGVKGAKVSYYQTSSETSRLRLKIIRELRYFPFMIMVRHYNVYLSGSSHFALPKARPMTKHHSTPSILPR